MPLTVGLHHEPPPPWADEAHLRELGARVPDVAAARRTVRITAIPRAGAFATTSPAAEHTSGGVREWKYLLLTCTRGL